MILEGVIEVVISVARAALIAIPDFVLALLNKSRNSIGKALLPEKYKSSQYAVAFANILLWLAIFALLVIGVHRCSQY